MNIFNWLLMQWTSRLCPFHISKNIYWWQVHFNFFSPYLSQIPPADDLQGETPSQEGGGDESSHRGSWTQTGHAGEQEKGINPLITMGIKLCENE